MGRGALLDHEERLAVLDGLAVLHASAPAHGTVSFKSSQAPPDEELARLFRFAAAEGFASVDPTEQIDSARAPKSLPRYLSLDEVENLLEIILDLGRVPSARFVEREISLREAEVSRAEIDYVDERVGDFDADNREAFGAAGPGGSPPPSATVGPYKLHGPSLAKDGLY